MAINAYENVNFFFPDIVPNPSFNSNSNSNSNSNPKPNLT